MHRISLRHFRLGLLTAIVTGTVSAACGDPLALPPARIENTIDTITLFALEGTDIGQPSAYDVINRRTARVDRFQPFDFAFDLDSTGAPLLLPSVFLGVFPGSGILISDQGFEGVMSAPIEGFTSDSIVPVALDDVLVVRSRTEQCSALLGSLPRYGKFRVLGIDPAARTITLEALVNANCGFRNLQPGFPED